MESILKPYSNSILWKAKVGFCFSSLFDIFFILLPKNQLRYFFSRFLRCVVEKSSVCLHKATFFTMQRLANPFRLLLISWLPYRRRRWMGRGKKLLFLRHSPRKNDSRLPLLLGERHYCCYCHSYCACSRRLERHYTPVSWIDLFCQPRCKSCFIVFLRNGLWELAIFTPF